MGMWPLFGLYILGCPFLIETDHKPLFPILNTKNLDNLPPQVLQFRLWLAIFEYTVQHVYGKFLYTADTLPQAPLRIEVSSLRLQDELKYLILHENLLHFNHRIVVPVPLQEEVMKRCMKGV